ncbi:hypothetical protein E2C01_043740 [Portunus trituberculatus]|uniref:Uncharacterized protein n=1 Tax=Portunus trituberculatus TaxID=210409 RepID=A0A5B7FX67_PORTR|nr:hypothetical protein [Portunus trituberculatus]
MRARVALTALEVHLHQKESSHLQRVKIIDFKQLSLRQVIVSPRAPPHMYNVAHLSRTHTGRHLVGRRGRARVGQAGLGRGARVPLLTSREQLAGIREDFSLPILLFRQPLFS